MKFKVDENLPIEIAELLRAIHHEARMVMEQGLSGEDDLHVVDVCRQEERILVTLDLDFADVRAYPQRTFRA
jgi:predicted nuclease of predicted toxin-antitoxin system